MLTQQIISYGEHVLQGRRKENKTDLKHKTNYNTRQKKTNTHHHRNTKKKTQRVSKLHTKKDNVG